MDALLTFLDMGGYGDFIWPAYVIVTIVLVGLLISSRRFVKAAEAELGSIKLPHQRGRREVGGET